MGFEELSQELSLANICKGELEADFQKMYRDIVAKLKKEEKGSIAITIISRQKGYIICNDDR